MRLTIQPLLAVNPQEIAQVVPMLSDTFGFDDIIMEQPLMEIPMELFERRRFQYSAQGLLELVSRAGKGRNRISLGVIEADIYHPGLNFVFGLARPGEAAVISLCRLRPEYYGPRADAELFRMRVVKEASHELGHVLGLDHCRSFSCVMFFSNSIADTDRKSHEFCRSCKERLSSSESHSNGNLRRIQR